MASFGPLLIEQQHPGSCMGGLFARADPLDRLALSHSISDCKHTVVNYKT